MAENVGEKLARNPKVNVNEVLTLYCAFIVSQVRKGVCTKVIQNNAANILPTVKVMVGVPETLRMITLETIVDDRPKKT